MDSDERREINDGRQRLFGSGDPARLIAFVCECGERDCHRTVPLTVTEYEARRPGLILARGHAPAGEEEPLSAGA